MAGQRISFQGSKETAKLPQNILGNRLMSELTTPIQ